MLEQIDLSKESAKVEYKQEMADLKVKLGTLQREIRAKNIPVIIVFEGWDAAGKGTLINRLLLSLDPRGFKVNPINPPTTDEEFRPFLWRFWTKTPANGQIAIFDRSWYGRVQVERVDKLVPKKTWQRAYAEITSFERQLADSGAVIVKLFLHISPKEQKKRFKKLAANKATAWKVTKDDWRHHRQHKKYLAAIEEMLAKTSTEFAPWTIVEAHDRRFATLKVFKTVCAALETKLNSASAENTAVIKSVPVNVDNVASSMLETVDLSKTLEREAYKEELKVCQKRLHDLEHEIYARRIPVVVAYEGWDAAGKGGNIKRLVQGMDPRGYEVIPIAAPNDIEKAHHYLWRFWQVLPKAGHIAILDRTWYGRVMVERIEGYCTATEWQRAYREINEFEEQLTNFGAVLFKFWLQIDKDEQLRRFEERKKNPHKLWKITDEDWRNREKWDEYNRAVNEMLVRTSTAAAPWTIVESNSKLFARIKVLKTVIERLEAVV